MSAGLSSVAKPKLDCEALFLSDIHLGTTDSKAREAAKLLKSCTCRKIILVGDIIDAWALKRGGRWNNLHTRFIRALLKKIEKEECEVLYVRGNHDDVLERFLPFSLGSLKITKDSLYTARSGKRYFITHGDGFDSITTNYRWVAALGSLGYDFLLAFNRYYNKWRAWRKKPYFSLSRIIKSKVKSAVSFINRYEDQLQQLARHKKCNGIICGHTHIPADKDINGIHYLNCGDWVESLSFIIETNEGEFRLHYYHELKDLMKDCQIR